MPEFAPVITAVGMIEDARSDRLSSAIMALKTYSSIRYINFWQIADMINVVIHVDGQ